MLFHLSVLLTSIGTGIQNLLLRNGIRETFIDNNKLFLFSCTIPVIYKNRLHSIHPIDRWM